MKAAVVEEPGVLAVHEVPMPEVGDYYALCEILYGATCSGTDLHIIKGLFPFGVDYPTILGHESTGRVIEVGAKVRNLKVGDVISRVGTPPVGGYSSTWGGFSQFGLACDHWAAEEDGRPREEWYDDRRQQVVPPDIDPAHATMIITWRETFSYITRMGVGGGASLLLIGSGGNGLSFAAHGANLGCSHIVIIGNPQREKVGQAAGATDYFSYNAEDVHTAIRETYPQSFDFIIDTVGKQGLLDAALGHVKDGGTVGIYGVDDYGSCMLNPVNAGGSFTYSGRGYDEAEVHDQVVAFMQQGKLDASLWLGLENPFRLKEINQAFTAVEQRKFVKALVQICENPH